MDRSYNVEVGGRKVTVTSKNGLYASREGLTQLGFTFGQLKRGRGQKAQLGAKGYRVYNVKTNEGKEVAVEAQDGFKAAEELLKTLGGTVSCTGKRGRPKGSKNTPKVVDLGAVADPVAVEVPPVKKVRPIKEPKTKAMKATKAPKMDGKWRQRTSKNDDGTEVNILERVTEPETTA